MFSGITLAPSADTDPEEPGSALARSPQPRRAAKQLPVASKLRLHVRALEDKPRGKRMRLADCALRSSQARRRRSGSARCLSRSCARAHARSRGRRGRKVRGARLAHVRRALVRRALGLIEREAEAEQVARARAREGARGQRLGLPHGAADRDHALQPAEAKAASARTRSSSASSRLLTPRRSRR